MAGIYLHIPFCRHKCSYCNFYSTASPKYRYQFAEAILKEAELEKNYLQEPVNTIYIGGGTPSIFPSRDIQKILTVIDQLFRVETNPEITMEANPDDLSYDYLNKLKNFGVNRISIGIQSIYSNDLKYLERTHDPAKISEVLEMLKNAGFRSINADLLYGIPGQTEQMLKDNIQRLVSSVMDHISAYALTVEPSTILERQIEKNRKSLVKEGQGSEQFNIVSGELKRYGFEQYEISNFAKHGNYSVHNTNYWFRKPYLGLGPSAHSFDGKSRKWNVPSVKKYMEGVRNENIPAEEEKLPKNQQFNEYVMLRLRTKWGINTDEIQKIFGYKYVDHLFGELEKLNKSSLFIFEGRNIKLTSRGLLFADGLSAELFVV